MLHTPVLVDELTSLFSEKRPPSKILDCTFGRGGHSLAFLNKFPSAHITALDCDVEAINYALSLKEVKEKKIEIKKQNFHYFPKSIKKEDSNPPSYDLILMDLGVSSPQLYDKDRGFSFYREGPLDMRMDRDQDIKASDIVNQWSKKELEELFQSYGEIKHPYKVVRAIVEQRRKKRFENTLELSSLIQKHFPRKSRHKHPATVWFLALRMVVNRELEGLKTCLPLFLPLLRSQGFFVVISFHSLEDRIVKQNFRSFVKEKKGLLFNKKVITPSAEERNKNPNSQSAKMRVFQKE